MKTLSKNGSRLSALLVASLGLLISLASAQQEKPAAGEIDRSRRDAKQARRPLPEPVWLLPPVEAPHLRHATFDSPAAGQKVSYLIYLPPGYEKSPNQRFPVVYWLHGIGGNQTGVPRFCAQLTAAIEAGKSPAMIFVFPNGMVDSFYCDALNAKRPVETVIIKDLIPHIDSTYRTIATRGGRMIEGFSMGGFGAVRLGFKYPGTFGSISTIDGALLGLTEIKQRHEVQFERIFANSEENFDAQSPWTLTEKNAAAVRGRTTIRMAVGALVGANANYHVLLERLKIEHDYETFPGAGHNLQAIIERMEDRNWEFYRRAFAAGEPGRRGGTGKAAAMAGPRPRDQTPSWLMPPVQGPNLHYRTFDSQAAGTKVSYLLYLPPDYEADRDRRYPVVYWLHGIGGGQQGVPLMAERLTQAIAGGKAPPMIVVYVNGMIRSSYVDSADGKTPVETVTIKELIPHIDATYRTLATREGRMVEGFSMGGSGAAKWGFKHFDLFGSISIIDGALHSSDDATPGKMGESFKTIYGGDRERFAASDPWKLAERNADKVKGRTTIRIVTRTVGLGGANEKFHALLDRLGLEHEFYKIPDAPHSPNPLYEGLGERNWPFYRKAFAAAAPAR